MKANCPYTNGRRHNHRTPTALQPPLALRARTVIGRPLVRCACAVVDDVADSENADGGNQWTGTFPGSNSLAKGLMVI